MSSLVLSWLVVLALNLSHTLAESECSVSQQKDEKLLPVSLLLEAIDARVELIAGKNALLGMLEDVESINISKFILFRRMVLYTQSFAWMFKDLNQLIWRYPEMIGISPNDTEYNKLKAMINDHTLEDGTHWEFFQYDWIKLGLNNNNILPSNVLEFFFRFVLSICLGI